MSEIKLRDAGPMLLTKVAMFDSDGNEIVGSVKVTDRGGNSYDRRPPAPRYVDDLCYEEQAVALDNTRSVKRLEAQLSDRRRWADEGFHQVDDSQVVVAMMSAAGHVLVVRAWRVGYYKPGTLGRWQRFNMERYEPDSYIDLGHASSGDGFAEDDTSSDGVTWWSGSPEAVLEEGAQLAFKWAAQLREQVRYDTEGYDTVVGAPDSWYRDHREFVRPVKTSWSPATMAEWKTVKLPTAGRPDSWKLPYMRNVGAAPDEGAE